MISTSNGYVLDNYQSAMDSSIPRPGIASEEQISNWVHQYEETRDIYTFLRLPKNSPDTDVLKQIKKLYLYWHPDKARGHPMSTQVTQILNKIMDDITGKSVAQSSFSAGEDQSHAGYQHQNFYDAHYSGYYYPSSGNSFPSHSSTFEGVQDTLDKYMIADGLISKYLGLKLAITQLETRAWYSLIYRYQSRKPLHIHYLFMYMLMRGHFFVAPKGYRHPVQEIADQFKEKLRFLEDLVPENSNDKLVRKHLHGIMTRIESSTPYAQAALKLISVEIKRAISLSVFSVSKSGAKIRATLQQWKEYWYTKTIGFYKFVSGSKSSNRARRERALIDFVWLYVRRNFQKTLRHTFKQYLQVPNTKKLVVLKAMSDVFQRARQQYPDKLNRIISI